MRTEAVLCLCCWINKRPVSAHSPRHFTGAASCRLPNVSCLGQLDRVCSSGTSQDDDTPLNPKTPHLHGRGYSGSFWLAPALESFGLRVCPSRCLPRLAQGLEPVLGMSGGKVWLISRQNRADGSFPSRKPRCFSCCLPLFAVEVPKALSQAAGPGFSPAGQLELRPPRVMILWLVACLDLFLCLLTAPFSPAPIQSETPA